AAGADTDPLEDPRVGRTEVESLEEVVRDLVLGMEVPEAVQEERHATAPATCSPPSTRMIAPLIQAASSEASRKIAFATSRVVVSRRNGLRKRACAARWS